jgi:hypothetical protein
MIDIQGIGESLRILLETNEAEFKMVRFQGDERDVNFANMPYSNIDISRMEPEIRAGSEYVVEGTYIVTVIALDLSSHNEAATIRNRLVKSSMEIIKANPRFYTDLESSILGPAQFADAKDEDTGMFMALATFEVGVIVFVNPL